MGVLLALLAALAYGTGDFAAGLASRRLAPALVALVVEFVALAAAVVGVLFVAGTGPTPSVLWWGALSGVGMALGTLSLYHGLSVARMSVVAPVCAVLNAALPVGVGLLLGEQLSALAVAAIMAAILAIALVSQGGGDTEGAGDTARPAGRSGTGPGLLWGSLAGAGFALLFVSLDRAGTGSGAWPLVPSQLVSILLVGPFAWAVRHPPPGAWRTAARPLALAGVTSGAATLLFLAATGVGQLAIVAVITALYSGVTVVLARIVLGERWSRLQAIGLSIAAVAIVATTLA